VTSPMRDTAALVGIGMTPLSRESGRSVLQLAIEAAELALQDAGLAAADIDAVLSYHMNDSAPVPYVARSLGIDPLGWHNEIFGGGTQSASILGDAAMLIASGLARRVLVFRALNGRSGKRMSQASLRMGAGAEEQFTLPYGMLGPVHLFALAAQRWLSDRKLGPEVLGHVVVTSRAHAAGNTRAMLRKPMTFEEYLASPMVASPLRRADCCLETDGAAAVIVASARDFPDAPRLRAVVRGGGSGSSTMDKTDDVSRVFSAYLAPSLYEAAAMAPRDVDVAMLYDAYSFLVLAQLEDFGFCGRGETPTFGLGAPVVNPNGGLLSEGYVHGLNNVLEAVRQLRAGASVALVTGFGGSYGSAAVLARD
jgi:acetyl-CoA acetyltransferase